MIGVLTSHQLKCCFVTLCNNDLKVKVCVRRDICGVRFVLIACVGSPGLHLALKNVLQLVLHAKCCYLFHLISSFINVLQPGQIATDEAATQQYQCKHCTLAVLSRTAIVMISTP